MRLEQSFVVPAPVEAVWPVLSDPTALAECFPGVEEVTRLDEVRTTALLRVKIGYISATFALDGEIVEMQAPYFVRSRVSGRDRKLGSTVTGETALRLSAAKAGAETEVHCAADMSITGQVASFGRAFIERKAKQDLGRFIANVQTRFAEARKKC